MTIQKYYYLDDDRKPIGPFSIEELSNLSAQGKINHKTLVAEDGGSAWIAWKTLVPRPRVEKYYYLDENNKPVGPFPLSRLSMLATIGNINQETLIAKDGATNWAAYREFISGNKTSQSREKKGMSLFKITFIFFAICALLFEPGIRGISQVEFSLMELYRSGRGVTKSDVSANKWLKRSLELGNPDAQFLAGKYYLEGSNGFQRSDMEAVALFKKSASQGNKMARDEYELLSKNLADPCYRLTRVLEISYKKEIEGDRLRGDDRWTQCKNEIHLARLVYLSNAEKIKSAPYPNRKLGESICLNGLKFMRSGTCNIHDLWSIGDNITGI